MPLGHLMLGLLGGMTAFALALLAGLPYWMAGLLYVGAGNLAVAISVALQIWADNSRGPPRRRTRRPARAAQHRSLHLSH